MLALLGPNELKRASAKAWPPWLSQVFAEAAKASAVRAGSSRPMRSLIRALFAQRLWSGPLVAPRLATAMWGKAQLLRSMANYRLGDLIIMRNNTPLDLSPLGKPSARVGKYASVVMEELSKPNTGLRLERVQLYHPSVKAFAAKLARVFATEVNVNGYASLSQGTIFPEHWDAHDVMLLQTHGTKVWRVRPNELPMPLACHRAVLKVAKQRPVTARLRAGRLLYMPRGHWHVGAGDESIHLTFGLPEDTVGLRVADVALKTLAKHLTDAAYRAPMFAFEPTSRSAQAALLACLEGYVETLRGELLDPQQLKERPAFFGRRFTER